MNGGVLRQWIARKRVKEEDTAQGLFRSKGRRNGSVENAEAGHVSDRMNGMTRPISACQKETDENEKWKMERDESENEEQARGVQKCGEMTRQRLWSVQASSSYLAKKTSSSAKARTWEEERNGPSVSSQQQMILIPNQ